MQDTSKEQVEGVQNRLRSLKNINPASEYTFFMLLKEENKKPHVQIHTEWRGWEDNARKIELRVPSVVNAKSINEFWNRLEIDCCVVNSLEDCILFMLAGGPGLIELEVSKQCFRRFWEPMSAVQTGLAGFVGKETLDENTFKRAPSAKKRMEILKRDGMMCRICGRRPTTNTDIELHIHHIRPWSHGGLSAPENLVTLCHTCHHGLEPHYDPSLFKFTSELPDDLVQYREQVLRQCMNYRSQSFLSRTKGFQGFR